MTGDRRSDNTSGCESNIRVCWVFDDDADDDDDSVDTLKRGPSSFSTATFAVPPFPLSPPLPPPVVGGNDDDEVFCFFFLGIGTSIQTSLIGMVIFFARNGGSFLHFLFRLFFVERTTKWLAPQPRQKCDSSLTNHPRKGKFGLGTTSSVLVRNATGFFVFKFK